MSRLRRLTRTVTARSPLAWLLLGLLAGYRRAVSPLLAPRCRFEPSCSCYAEEAVRSHGAVRGTWLAGRRLLRCQPWGGLGDDPVPPRRRPVAIDAAAGRPRRQTSISARRSQPARAPRRTHTATRGGSTRVDHR